MAGQRPVMGIFSGGGVKAAAFLGAIRQAQEHVRFDGWGGTSAGSIVAALLACGYSTEELQDVLYEAPYGEFFKVNPLRVALIKYYKGVVNPNPLLGWLQAHIEKKCKHRGVTFKTLQEKRPLKIVAADIATRQIKVFSRKETPNTEIATAVLASCSFPLIFPSVKNDGRELVDGGVLSNFPMWLFDDELEPSRQFTPVLGFSLISETEKPVGSSLLQYVYSVFQSVLIAQDRIQEKYLDTARSSNIIRIPVPLTATFSSKRSKNDHDALIDAGSKAAAEYFKVATTDYGRPIPARDDQQLKEKAKGFVDSLYFDRALSLVARQHLLHGGVARDDGLIVQRKLVRYYVDLMGAVVDRDKLDLLARILAARITERRWTFHRVVALKKGNILLAHSVAELLKKPLCVFKTDMSYKMGPPFDGALKPEEHVIIVDDIASDASILLSAVRHVSHQGASVLGVVTLIERTEGDARERLRRETFCGLWSVCKVDDDAVERLIQLDVPFALERWDVVPAHAQTQSDV